MQKARRHPSEDGLRPLVGKRFQILFTPCQGCFSPFPHGTCSLSVVGEYLALGGGPPRFTRNTTCSALLGCLSREANSAFIYGTFTLYGWPSQAHSISRFVCNFSWEPPLPTLKSHNPNCTTLAGLHVVGLGSSPFARRYLGNRYYFLFHRVLRCFSSPG